MSKSVRWESDPITNWIMNKRVNNKTCDRVSDELRRLNYAAHQEKPIAFHKSRLGRQSYTWLGEGRMWVWESDTWRVYVSNWKGVYVEIRADLSVKQALSAWDDYLTKMGLKT